jgi:hypothetical protein
MRGEAQTTKTHPVGSHCNSYQFLATRWHRNLLDRG